MLLKYCTQYASKFRKLSGGHRTGKGQFSFQFQRRAMPKNVQTTTQLHSFHMLSKLFSKFAKLGFNSMWTENFQIFKLDLEKAEKPEIKLQTSVGSSKMQESSRKTSTSAFFFLNLFSFWYPVNANVSMLDVVLKFLNLFFIFYYLFFFLLFQLGDF